MVFNTFDIPIKLQLRPISNANLLDNKAKGQPVTSLA